MLLGKPPGPPIMRRTTSISDGLAVDTHTNTDELMSDSLQHDQQGNIKVHPHDVAVGTLNEHSDRTKFVSQAKGSHEYGGGRFMGMGMAIPLSPTTARHTHNYAANTNTHTSHFLLTCALCKCRLAPGRDIYMYRGDTAFCSLECREKQMKQEQRKEKLKAGSGKEHRRAGKANTSKTETTACN